MSKLLKLNLRLDLRLIRLLDSSSREVNVEITKQTIQLSAKQKEKGKLVESENNMQCVTILKLLSTLAFWCASQP